MTKTAKAAPVPAPELTASVEDYLKAVYDLERAGEPAATTELQAGFARRAAPPDVGRRAA